MGVPFALRFGEQRELAASQAYMQYIDAGRIGQKGGELRSGIFGALSTRARIYYRCADSSTNSYLKRWLFALLRVSALGARESTDYIPTLLVLFAMASCRVLCSVCGVTWLFCYLSFGSRAHIPLRVVKSF